MKKLASQLIYSSPVRSTVMANPEVGSYIMLLLRRLRRERANTGGSNTARYCYSVWLRHLVVAHRCKVDPFPRTAMELGPGDSIGIGIMSLMCGADTYYALDAHPYANVERSLTVFDDLVRLFQKREPIPHTNEATDVEPVLDSYDFPSHVLTPEKLAAMLEPRRLASIRSAIERMGGPAPSDAPVRISYVAPWTRGAEIPPNSVDLIFSQAVLEHVEDLKTTYAAMYEWCRPGGNISHLIDLQSHGTSLDWNGHWVYSEAQWQRVKNPQTYRFINRQPCSAHLRLIRECGFKVVSVIRGENRTGIGRAKLAPQWRSLTDEDLTCYSLHVIARKPPA